MPTIISFTLFTQERVSPYYLDPLSRELQLFINICGIQSEE